jgi:hypothetical protein
MDSQEFDQMPYDIISCHQDVLTSKDLDFATEDKLEDKLFTIFDGEELFTSMDELIPVEDVRKEDLLFGNSITNMFDNST